MANERQAKWRAKVKEAGKQIVQSSIPANRADEFKTIVQAINDGKEVHVGPREALDAATAALIGKSADAVLGRFVERAEATGSAAHAELVSAAAEERPKFVQAVIQALPKPAPAQIIRAAPMEWAIAILVGILIGGAAGYVGGWWARGIYAPVLREVPGPERIVTKTVTVPGPERIVQKFVLPRNKADCVANGGEWANFETDDKDAKGADIYRWSCAILGDPQPK